MLDTQKQIGQRVRQTREAKGLSLEEVGRRAHLSWTTVQRLETGKALRLRTLEKIADALGVRVADLLNFTEAAS